MLYETTIWDRNRASRAARFAGVLLAVAVPGLSVAQTDTAADPAPIEEITVTGFRSSPVSAISNKRDSDSVVESVTAEDLGKLPDISIAESLARLPGVTAQRTGGQASALNIRGLDQGLILTTLNGASRWRPAADERSSFRSTRPG